MPSTYVTQECEVENTNIAGVNKSADSLHTVNTNSLQQCYNKYNKVLPALPNVHNFESIYSIDFDIY